MSFWAFVKNIASPKKILAYMKKARDPGSLAPSGQTQYLLNITISQQNLAAIKLYITIL